MIHIRPHRITLKTSMAAKSRIMTSQAEYENSGQN